MTKRALTKAVGLVIVAMVVAAGEGVLAQGTPARLIPFQARLTGADGQPLDDGVYPLTFRIYDAATGGVECWTEQHASASVVGGQLNVILGSLTQLDDPNNDSNQADAIGFNPNGNGSGACQGPGSRFLGITVGANAQEMVPRHQLVPSFHARRADSADAVKDGGVTTNMLADNAVTGLKIADGAITGAKIGSLAGAIKGSDVTTVDINALESANIKDQSLKGVDVTTVDAEALTGANIKDGSVQDQDLSVLPYVRAYRTTDSVQVGNNNFIVLTFDQERADIVGIPGMHCKPGDIAGDPSCNAHPSSRLVAPRAGVYLIGADVRISKDCNECALTIRVTKNDSTSNVIAFDRPVTAGTMSAISLTTTYQLAAGEYAEVILNPGSTNDINAPVEASAGIANGLQGVPATVLEYSPVFWMVLLR